MLANRAGIPRAELSGRSAKSAQDLHPGLPTIAMRRPRGRYFVGQASGGPFGC
jgi:hypothetical protein